MTLSPLRSMSAMPDVTNPEELPLMLRVGEVQRLLGVGEHTAYQVLRSLHAAGDAIRIGTGLAVPRDRLLRRLTEGDLSPIDSREVAL